MADKSIGELPLVTDILDADKFLLEQSGKAKRLEGGILRAYAAKAGEDAAGNLQRGYRGYGITAVELTNGNHAPGTLDTYTVRFENGDSSTFEVYNGLNGMGAVNSVNGAVGTVVTRIRAANKSVATSAWKNNTTYADYPYRASVSISGATADMIPDVMFALEQINEGIYAPVAETYAGGVYLYASSVPAAAITIPMIEVRA